MDYSQLLMMLPMLLQMLSSQGGSGGSASGGGGTSGIDPSSLIDMLGSINPGSMPSSGSGGSSMNPLMALFGGMGGSGGGMGGMGGMGGLGGLFSMFGGSSGGSSKGGVTGGLEGALSGGVSGAEMGSMAGPWGALAGGIIGALMSGLGGAGILGGGVPTQQKTLGVESGLARSNDPIAQMLAQYVQGDVLGKGDVLSSPGGAGFGKMAQMLEWLSGDSLPGLSSGTATIGGVSGIPVPRDISRLNAMLGQSPNMSPQEIQAFLPQIESMVSGGGGLKNLSGQIEAMINSVSGQKKAGLGGVNSTASSNPLMALFGGGGGGGTSSSDMSKILAQFKNMSMPGTGSNFVGASA